MLGCQDWYNIDVDMSPVIFSVLLIFCCLGTIVTKIDEPCRTDAYPPPQSTALKNYVVNLDLSPVKRWTHVVKDKQNEMVQLLRYFTQLLGEKYMEYVEAALGLMTSFLKQPYQDELRGLSNATNIPIGEVALYNIFYEVNPRCTSIVGQDESGKIYHARNMDFGSLMGWDTKNNTWMVTELLRNLVISVDFQRNGKTVYKAITFAGYIGALTAVKQDAFTLSIDSRGTTWKFGKWIGIMKWALQLGKSDARWLGFFTREVLENATSYKEAKNMLAYTELIAPAYFILGGTTSGEGCVISRNQTKAVDIWELQSKDKPDQWFLIETNYDHWKTPLFLDDRRTPAIKCMNEMTRKSIGFKGLFNVLSTKPVLNKSTVYTALMQALGGQLESYLQNCRDPCWPW